jgi:hypothetical protein
LDNNQSYSLQIRYIEELEEKVKMLERAMREAQATLSGDAENSPQNNSNSVPRITSPGDAARQNDEEEGENENHAVDDIGSEIDFLSLNAMAETNTITSRAAAEPFGLSHIVQAAIQTDNTDPTSSKRSNPLFHVLASSCLPTFSPNLVAKLPSETARIHFEHYFRYVHLSYPFLHHSTVLKYYEQVVSTPMPETLHQKIQSVLVHLVLAVGILTTDIMAQHSSFFANHFFLVANQYLDDVFLIDNVETTQVLLLLAVFSLFSPCGGSTWHFVALAMRRCISLGFHRRSTCTAHARNKRLSEFDVVQIKWLFWSTYAIDRFVINFLRGKKPC